MRSSESGVLRRTGLRIASWALREDRHHGNCSSASNMIKGVPAETVQFVGGEQGGAGPVDASTCTFID